MAVLNVTPDSFSDGGKLASLDAVVRAGRRARRGGAAILDVGGESTRPLAAVVDVDEELRRVVPAIRALAERVGLPISVDTRRAGVFREAYAAGAGMLNDVSALRFDPELGKAAAGTDAAVLLMHARGTPETMDSLAVYDDVVDEVAAELYEAVVRAENSGVRRDSILVDPGLGSVIEPWRRHRERFLAALATFDEDQWLAPTHCTDWNARDVISHLITVDQFFVVSLLGAQSGTPTEMLPGFDPKAIPELLVAPLRAKSAAELLDEFAAGQEAYVQTVDALSPED